MSKKQKYHFSTMVFDLVMFCITGGLWVFWMFYRWNRDK